MAHNNYYKRPYLLIMPILLLGFAATLPPPLATATDADILINFRNSMSNHTMLDDWDPSVPICQWSGLVCVNESFYGLKLEGMGLTGVIDVTALSQLSNPVRSLSVMRNDLGGKIPEVKQLDRLRALYLSYNGFSGEIPEDVFRGMQSLKKVYLARNQFRGSLPESLLGVSKLMELDVEGNQFEGRILEFKQENWKFLSFANNQFEGPIPASLSKIDRTAFFGNRDLCGAPLEPCKSSKKKHFILIPIIVLALAVIAIIGLVLFLRARRAQSSETKLGGATKVYKKFAACDKAQNSADDPYDEYKKSGENRTLHFMRNDRDRFGLEDLLRASAEVLGSGSFGSSYKAVLFSGPAMVVKRFRHMNNVGREQFHAHMARLGRLSHPNLLPLVAYYYRKDEKLLISDFVENGSLATHLHGKRAAGQPGLDWPTRLNIIKGVSRGLAYLYKEIPDLTLPHGHLKSSNVLLGPNLSPLLTEYALAPLVNKDQAQQSMAAFKSPELSDHKRRRITADKADIWTLGILILELLTGKFPENYMRPSGSGGGRRSTSSASSAAETGDLAEWVNWVVREEWTGEVFDKEMRGSKGGEGEMLKLLKIGMCCCERRLERRWDWREAAARIDELRERETEEEYSSYVTDWDVYSSMAPSDEGFSFSVNG